MSVHNYASDSVNWSFQGYNIGGYAKGSFAKVTRNEDSFKLTIGASGEGARAGSADKSGTVELTLLQTSASNDVLSGFLEADERLKAGGGTLIGKDLLGRTVCFANVAWIKKWPEVEFTQDVEGRAWMFETDNLTIFAGGNT